MNASYDPASLQDKIARTNAKREGLAEMKEDQALEGAGVAPTESTGTEASGMPGEAQTGSPPQPAQASPAPPGPERAPSKSGGRWSRLVKLDVLLASGVFLIGIAMAIPYFLGRIRRSEESEKKPYTVEQVGAMHLRMQAADACEKGQWSLCLAKLDDAKGLDPPGDAEEYVKSARQVAERMLQQSDASAGGKSN
jgi:hypothetical protein